MGGQLDGLLSHWQPAFANKLMMMMMISVTSMSMNIGLLLLALAPQIWTMLPSHCKDINLSCEQFNLGVKLGYLCKPVIRDTSGYGTAGGRSHLHSPSDTERLGNRSFAVAGPRLWNNLPVEFRQWDICLSEFRRLLRTFLFCWDSAPCDFCLSAPCTYLLRELSLSDAIQMLDLIDWYYYYYYY